jgi:hypothetical protein
MDIGVQTTAYQVEDRSWLLSPHGTEPGTDPSVTLDITKFTAGTHFPNGYIKSGCVLGKVTASGLYGPYDDAASDGRQTAVYLLFSSVRVTRQDGTNPAKIGAAGLIAARWTRPSCRSRASPAHRRQRQGRPQAHQLLDRRLTGG